MNLRSSDSSSSTRRPKRTQFNFPAFTYALTVQIDRPSKCAASFRSRRGSMLFLTFACDFVSAAQRGVNAVLPICSRFRTAHLIRPSKRPKTNGKFSWIKQGAFAGCVFRVVPLVWPIFAQMPLVIRHRGVTFSNRKSILCYCRWGGTSGWGKRAMAVSTASSSGCTYLADI